VFNQFCYYLFICFFVIGARCWAKGSHMLSQYSPSKLHP
jgi:hypothetical protein